VGAVTDMSAAAASAGSARSSGVLSGPLETFGVPLSTFTTLRVGGPARCLVTATTTDAVIDAVSECDGRREPVLVLSGGSNLLVADDGFDGTVVRIATRGAVPDDASACGGLILRVAAGEPWDAVAALAVERGWVGVEALAGIPGSTGATPVQNVGAYGQEVAETIATVRTWDRQEGRIRTLASADCEFGYRTSRLKHERFRGGPRFIVLEVTFQLRIGDLGAPVRYAELASALGVGLGRRAPLAAVRDAVLALRRRKGMVLDDADPDTWSAGSFFTNPVLDPDRAAALPPGAPLWPMPDGCLKTSAAWLIERAGFTRGHGLPGPAALSTKHTLAVTNRGGAAASDLVRLAREIRDGVRATFGLVLEPEPVLVGCAL
jgi:UDP-N-acetylmuramate dehydrogenase